MFRSRPVVWHVAGPRVYAIEDFPHGRTTTRTTPPQEQSPRQPRSGQRDALRSGTVRLDTLYRPGDHADRLVPDEGQDLLLDLAERIQNPTRWRQSSEPRH